MGREDGRFEEGYTAWYSSATRLTSQEDYVNIFLLFINLLVYGILLYIATYHTIKTKIANPKKEKKDYVSVRWVTKETHQNLIVNFKKKS